jgi:hypothetical protein
VRKRRPARGWLATMLAAVPAGVPMTLTTGLVGVLAAGPARAFALAMTSGGPVEGWGHQWLQ